MSKGKHDKHEAKQPKKVPKPVLLSVRTGTDQRLPRVAQAGVDSGYLAELARELDTTELGAGNPAVRLLRDGVPALSNDFFAGLESLWSRSVAS